MFNDVFIYLLVYLSIYLSIYLFIYTGVYIYIFCIYTYYNKDLTASNLSWPWAPGLSRPYQALYRPGLNRFHHLQESRCRHFGQVGPGASGQGTSLSTFGVGDLDTSRVRFCDDFFKNDLRWSEYMSKTKVRTSSKHLKIIQTTCQGKESNSFFI